VNATILFVGEERFLSKTRAQILRGLKTVIADSTDAPQEIHARAYDLVSFCHTIPDSVAKEIMASTGVPIPVGSGQRPRGRAPQRRFTWSDRANLWSLCRGSSCRVPTISKAAPRLIRSHVMGSIPGPAMATLTNMYSCSTTGEQRGA
jgi:hypothetical protein